MFKTDKTIYKVILGICTVCIILGLYFNAKILFSPHALLVQKLYTVFAFMGLVYAIFYVYYGYKKEAAPFYRNFDLFLLLHQTVSLTIAFTINPSFSNSFVLATEFVLILSLNIIEDYGKNPTFITCAILIVINLVSLFTTDGSQLAFYAVYIKLILSCLHGILAYAKYLDKQERGAK